MKIVRENINEMSIKHLTPKTQDELRSSIENMTPIEKFKLGCKENLFWLIDEVIKKEKIDVNQLNPVYSYHLCKEFYSGNILLAKYFINKYSFNIHNEHEKALRYAIWQFEVDFSSKDFKNRKIKLAKYLLDLGADINEAIDFANINNYIEQYLSLTEFKIKYLNK
jgi:hypothetical protein